MIKNNYFVLTGAMGAGKSTVLNSIKEQGHLCVEEPAREILKGQRKINGEGVPEKNAELFNQLMLQRMIGQYENNVNKKEIIIFDRGIPDIIGYSDLLNTKRDKAELASKEFRYSKYVFLFKGWKEIYTNDEERKMSYMLAENYGENIMKNYEELGYVLLNVPFVTVEERVTYILGRIEEILKGKYP
ncbi:MAG TPA: AAA family ATPase [Ignavibacteria bacterium]|nr:AAA family ATPase [Ignavibacteria bacterium]